MRTAAHDEAVEAYYRSSRERKAPRIHALISFLWERLQVEQDESKRQNLNAAVVWLTTAAERGMEVSQERDAELRREYA